MTRQSRVSPPSPGGIHLCRACEQRVTRELGRLVSQAVCHRRRGRAARRARHSRPGGVLGDAGAIHADGRGFPARLLDNRPAELRGNHDVPAADSTGQGQGLFPHDRRRQQVRS